MQRDKLKIAFKLLSNPLLEKKVTESIMKPLFPSFLIRASVFGVLLITGTITISQLFRPISGLNATEAPVIVAQNENSLVLSGIDSLDLTDSQTQEIEAIQDETEVQMSEVLTPEQMEQFKAERAEGEDTRSILVDLGLDPSQGRDIKVILRNTRNQILMVLTPEQRAQIRQK